MLCSFKNSIQCERHFLLRKRWRRRSKTVEHNLSIVFIHICCFLWLFKFKLRHTYTLIVQGKCKLDLIFFFLFFFAPINNFQFWLWIELLHLNQIRSVLPHYRSVFPFANSPSTTISLVHMYMFSFASVVFSIFIRLVEDYVSKYVPANLDGSKYNQT